MGTSLRRVLPILFFLSGFVSLGLQVTWNRVLGQVVGTDHVSATIIVSIYMLGLGLGGYLGSKLCGRFTKSLQLAFWVEIVLSLYCFISVPLMRYGQKVSLALTDTIPSLGFIYADVIVYFSILIIPTLMMGISLPIFVHHYRKNEAAGYVVGLLYGVNIFGALTGAMIGGVVLLPSLGITKTVALLSVINILWSLFGLILANKSKDAVAPPTYSSEKNPLRTQYYALSFLIGFVALSYEIIYFRMFVYFMTATNYVFPIILFCYLIHMTIGNLFSGFWLKSNKPISKLIKILSSGAIASTTIVFLVPTFMHYAHLGDDFFIIGQLSGKRDIFESLLLGFFSLTPVAFISAFFPILIHKISSEKDGVGAVVGRVYLTQTLGNFSGSLVTGLVFLPTLGLINTVLLMLAGILVVNFWLFKYNTDTFSFRTVISGNAIVVIFSILALLPINPNFLKQIRYRGEPPTRVSEEMEGTAFIYEHPQGGARIQIGAEPATSYNGVDFYNGSPNHPAGSTVVVDTLRGNKAPENILIIGIGTGILAMSLKAIYPESKITIVELLDVVIREMEAYGSPQLKALLKSSDVVITDGRRFLNKVDGTTKYDIIQVGVFHVVSSGAGNLFTKEIQQRLKDLLTPSGVLTFNAYINPLRSSIDIFEKIAIVGIGNGGIADLYLGGSEINVDNLSAASIKNTLAGYNKAAEINGDLKAFNFTPSNDLFVIKDRQYIEQTIKDYLPQTDDMAVTEYFLNHTITLPGFRDPRIWPDTSSEKLVIR